MFNQFYARNCESCIQLALTLCGKNMVRKRDD